MQEVITGIITFVLGNFPLTFLIIGLIASGISLARRPKPLDKGAVVDAFLSHFVLWSMGISFLYNFVLHVFFAEMTAGYIGWANSPFQYEVGYASLGYGVAGIIAFRQGLAVRTVAIVGPALFLWGAACGHVYQIVTAHNMAPGNAGVFLYTDIFLPVIGIALLLMQKAWPAPARR